MSLLTRWFAPSVAKAAEGEFRPGPYLLNGGWLSASAGSFMNWWQMGHDLTPYSAGSAMVEACVSAYSQTVAMCPGDHWRLLPNGGRERVPTAQSALARILRRPNEYQTISDFLMNLTEGLYRTGKAYAFAVRNDRNEIAELHLMNPRDCSWRVAEDGSVFYNLSGNEIVENRFGPLNAVPARDVLHPRLKTPRHPLEGVTPMLAAALDVAAGSAAMERQLTFFRNQARPGFALSTDAVLHKPQRDELVESVREQTTGDKAGSTMVLTAGLKPIIMSTTATDAQLAETMKMSDQNIALAFGVPLARLGLGGAIQSSTEQLMQQWIATGLGFALNHIELAFDALFRLKGVPEEYTEFSTAALLRSAFKDRIEGLARSAISGIHSNDEARAELELPAVPGGYGAEPRVQQQVVPLSAWEKGQEALAAAPAPPAPPAPPAEEEDPDDAERYAPAAIRRRIDAQSRPLH